MRTVLSLVKKTFLYSAVLVIGGFTAVLPLGSTSVHAEEACVAPADTTYGAGVHHPVGAEAVMYTYDCDSETWVSPYYIYYPASNSRVATYARDYSYDCAASQWYMTNYSFSPGDGTYHKSRITTTSPGLDTGCPALATESAPTNTPTDGQTGTAATTTGTNGIANTGPGSTNGTSNSGTSNTNTTNNNTFIMGNGISSQANTGNAGVFYNTSGGNAVSGDAQSVANIANLLQSSSNVFGPGTAMFTADINGNVTGDFMFDPSAIMSTGPGSNSTASSDLQINTNNTNDTNAQINNTIDVGATSGDATVSSNTSGGDATSGDATAIVNLMNLINSTVSAGQSFVGTININGNLNGDILLPQNLIDQLIASTGSGSTNTATTAVTANTTTTNATTAGIANNITSSANTGDATVSGNTSAGGATSGQANTNVTLLNLTGSNVIGANNILVFVNVLGHWVGMIVNAPAGSTAASLGGGITGTGPGSSNSTDNSLTANSTLTNTNNLGINNAVNVHATSGDATVSGNTTGGNATSGDAKTAVNILNIAGSNLNLSNLFGVLFINVFGDWNGSFGVNTAAGDPVAAPAVQASADVGGAAPEASSTSRQFLSFATHDAPTTTTVMDNPEATTTVAADAQVLSAKTSEKAASKLTTSTADATDNASYILPAIGISIAAFMLLGERIAAIRKSHQA